MAEQQQNTVKMRALDPILYPPNSDLLHEKSEFIDRFYQLISQSIEAPFAISVDGLWGTGKTTIMKLLEKKLRYEGGYSTFWFNPWKYRNTESVVLAFLRSLAAEHSDLVDILPASSMKILKVLLKSGMRATLNILTMKSVSLKNVESDMKEIEDAQKSSHEKFSDSVKMLEHEFQTLIEAIGQKYSKQTVIIFFDDLDRCLPEDAIQLLEALKNLFVAKGCNCIFICGIDTRVAKKFIQKHYGGIEDEFAINYFRKIFNLTISMPFNPKTMPGLLQQHVRDLLNWSENDTKALAGTIANCGRQADMKSVRKYLNVANNFYTFLQFNPKYDFSAGDNLIVALLVLKESWQPLYEDLVQEAMKNRAHKIQELIGKVNEGDDRKLLVEQAQYLADFLVHPFPDVVLCDKLLEYPTLA